MVLANLLSAWPPPKSSPFTLVGTRSCLWIMMNYTPKHPFGARCEHVYTSTTSQGQRVGGISRRSTHRYGVSHATRSLLHYGQIDFRVYSSLRFGAAAVGALVGGVACRVVWGSVVNRNRALALRVAAGWHWHFVCVCGSGSFIIASSVVFVKSATCPAAAQTQNFSIYTRAAVALLVYDLVLCFRSASVLRRRTALRVWMPTIGTLRAKYSQNYIQSIAGRCILDIFRIPEEGKNASFGY